MGHLSQHECANDGKGRSQHALLPKIRSRSVEVVQVKEPLPMLEGRKEELEEEEEEEDNDDDGGDCRDEAVRPPSLLVAFVGLGVEDV
eukprot:CAMPEP_0185269528 /NCGR_PEP_ID=MMETSP1359-20130426/40113_1 /TAXON_ID=552665 /ORGANISM="Bigelowiella longifila, Strain CCMP242" /LENGTH=87 /DNA_ID=CAMNT_0027860741 /DNA_START=406 /DNA_END=670 /DNA_ORIENTATION=-